MILVGLLRSLGGVILFIKGANMHTDVPMIATSMQITIVAWGLVIVGLFLIFAAINLLRKITNKSWSSCWIALLLFLLDGVMNGFLLFGHPLDRGQMINVFATILISLFLILGRPAKIIN